MNILLLGSGGREHAFAYKIAQSKLCTKLFIAPGNPGTAEFGTNINISATDFPALKEFSLKEKIKKGTIKSWENIHQFYIGQTHNYPTQKLQHALACYAALNNTKTSNLSFEDFDNLLNTPIVPTLSIAASITPLVTALGKL